MIQLRRRERENIEKARQQSEIKRGRKSYRWTGVYVVVMRIYGRDFARVLLRHKQIRWNDEL